MLQRKMNQIDTKEHRLLRSFLETSFFEKFSTHGSSKFTVIEEPYTGFGYADAVGIIFDGHAYKSWSPHRNKLKNDDIKILHHLYLCNKGRSLEDLNSELGFSKNFIERSIKRLDDANTIYFLKDNRVKNQPINKIFFLKEIIAIEAKLKDWKGALLQSKNNLSFCSRAYSLFPKDVNKENFMNRYQGTGVGVITHKEKYKIELSSKKNNIPKTLNSWLFNEYVGRMLL